MGFISMMVAMVVLCILMVGFTLLILGLFEIFIWIVRAVFRKKTAVVLNVFGILCTIAGIVMFVMPIALFLTLGTIGKISKAQKFLGYDEKVYISENTNWTEGFTFDGKNLVPIEFINKYKDNETEVVGALVREETNKVYEVEKVTGDSGYPVYEVDGYGGLYCAEEDVEALYDYYYEEAPYTSIISVSSTSTDGDSQQQSIAFEREWVLDILSLYETKECDYVGPVSETQDSILISCVSDDKMFYKTIIINVANGEYYLSKSLGGGECKGMYLYDYQVAWIEDALRQIGCLDE